MTEFAAGEHHYRSRRLCAVDQWQLLQRLKPILPALRGMQDGLAVASGRAGDVANCFAPLLSANEDELRAVFRACLAACERLDAGDWQPVQTKPALPILMAITANVVSLNFGALFSMERPSFRPVYVDAPVYDPVCMPGGEDWLFRPVLRGLCRAESLYDGTLRIEQLAKLNDALDVEAENQTRAMKAAEKKR